MRSRRGFIGGMVGTAALLSGCIGTLQSDSDGDSGDGGSSQPYASAVGSILISPSINSASAEVQVSLLDAQSVIVERNGREITTITADTNDLKVVDEDVESGDLFELVAVYPDGSQESVYDRCYDCESTGGEGSDGGSQNESDPSASFWFGSMAPLEGYLVNLDLTVSSAESVAILHNGTEIVVYQQGGEYDLAGNEEDDRPLLFEEVEFGDEFRAVARFGDGSEEEIAEELVSTG